MEPALSLKALCALIREHRLPREVIPSERLACPQVWEALLEQMPMTALMRNLATLTRIGLIAPLSSGTATVVEQLNNGERLRKARIHPLQILAALKTYAQGKGIRGQQQWTPVQPVLDALDGAFYRTFDHVLPTGKRILLAVDCSGSMDGGAIGGVTGLTPRIGAAALALVTAAVEPHAALVGFTAGAYASRFGSYGCGLQPLAISPRQRLDSVINTMAAVPFGGTDCALPMVWALQQRLPVDAFVILTDSETWAGTIHPAEALAKYRRKMGIPAKLIVVGMTSNGFSIGDPMDAGTLNVVGFSPDVPALMNDFIRGTL